jgi:tetratricopeptide (TPR) repeat protein
VTAVRGARPSFNSGLLIAAAVAAVVTWLAYDNGTYSLSSRATVAIVLWWAIVLGISFGLLAATRLPRAALAAGGLLVALALWTLASVLWAPSAEAAMNEFNRVSLYLAVFAFAVLAASRGTVGRWADGLALGIAAVAVVALVSRLFPDTFSDRGLGDFLPGVATRLSFPIGYWNGLAIFAALGVPLLLRVALVARSSVARGLALAPIPAVVSVMFLASSRGGFATAFLGTLVFLGLTERRWSTAAAVLTAGLASAAAIAFLLERNDLVDGPLGSERARDQGVEAAVWIVLSGLAAALAFALGCALLGGRFHPSKRLGHLAVGLGAAALIAGVFASDPVERFDTFRAPPSELQAIDRDDFVRAHLLSGRGSGRWQIWSAAVDQGRENMPLGDGAGSYERWWAEHAPHAQFVRDAHSLYLEALGELGPLGLVLVVALFGVGIVTGARRALLADGDARVTVAALTAVVVAFAAVAAIDWVWELAAVGIVAVTALALVTGPATEIVQPLRTARPGETRTWTSRHRLALGVLTVVAAWALNVFQAIPFVADRELGESQAAMRRGDLGTALAAADSSRVMQPWASTPYLQLALVSEARGELRAARRWIGEAIERDDRNWRLWLVAARLDTKLGRVEAAERSLRRAAELNRRSPLFVELFEERGP